MVKYVLQQGAQVQSAHSRERNIRREANEDLKEMKKDKLLAEDEAHRGQEEVQKITDDWTSKLEAQAAEKEKEIMAF